MKTKKENDYEVKNNSYGGLIFFTIIVLSLSYIITHDTSSAPDLMSNPKEINTINIKGEIDEETEEIKELRKYLNLGDKYTFKIYQSMYNYDLEVTTDNLNEETMLYIAYKYLEKQIDFQNHFKYITCDIAKKIGIEENITQCGGTKYNSTYYTVNTYINKEILTKAVKKIFNVNIKNNTNFYTSEDNVCYYIENDYICISHKTQNNKDKAETTFIKAYKDNSKIEIIEKYKYIKDGIYYSGFESDEIGEIEYISTFTKINGKYYWTSTKPYEST